MSQTTVQQGLALYAKFVKIVHLRNFCRLLGVTGSQDCLCVAHFLPLNIYALLAHWFWKRGYGNWLAALANSWWKNLGSEWEWVTNDRAVPCVIHAYGVRKLWGFLHACILLQCWSQQAGRSTFFTMWTQGYSSSLVFNGMYYAKSLISRWHCSMDPSEACIHWRHFWPWSC